MVAAPRLFAFRISFFYAASFFVGGLVTPFLPVWLKYRGLDAEHIAVALAFPLAARVLFMPVGSWIADRAPNRRFAIILFAALAFALFVPATLMAGYAPILLFTGLAITVSGLAMPALDALALTGLRRFGLDYGKMRAWGSISFVIVSTVGGTIYGHFGASALTYLLAGSFAIAAICAFALPVTPPEERAADDVSRPRQKPAWSILWSPAFLVIVASTALVQASHGIFYSFGSIHWQALGFTGGEIGLLWSVGVVAEILMFLFSGRLRRLGAENLILIGAVASLIRWALFPLATGLAFSLVLQLTHALTFAAVFFGMQLAIARTVPEEMTASAQGLCQVAGGLALAFSTLIGGPLYAHLGYVSFWVATLFSAAAILVLVLPRIGWISPRDRALAD